MKTFKIHIKFASGLLEIIEYVGEDNDTPDSIQLRYQKELADEFIGAVITNVVEA